MMDKYNIVMSFFRDGKTVRQINRETGIHRRTIKKYIEIHELQKTKLIEQGASDKELIELITSEPKYDSSNRARRKLSNNMIKEIQNCLAENELKLNTARRKNVKKIIDIHEHLLELGYDISYSTVSNYIREHKRKIKEAYIRQEYAPGDVCEFDWGCVTLEIAGKQQSYQMGAFVAAHNTYRFAHLYRNQKMENFLDFHVKYFKKAGGVYKTVVYDNLRTAVKRFVSKTEKEATDDLVKMSLYYNFRYRFCNVAKGNEKGHVERSVEYIRRRVFSKKDKFQSLEEANEFLTQELVKLNSKVKNNTSPMKMQQQERAHLLPLLPDYDTARTSELRVNKYSCVTIDENKYSVPDDLVGEFVFVKIYPDYIYVYYKQKQVAKHLRSYKLQSWTIDINHYLNTIKKKPGSLHSSTALHQMNPKLQQIYKSYYTQNPKDFLELLEIISDVGLGRVIDAINKLAYLNPNGVNTEKVKLLCTRTDEKVETIAPISSNTIEIETGSRFILNHYGNILNASSFDKEVPIV